MEGAFDVDEVHNEEVKRRLHQLQKIFLAKRRRVLANVLKLFALTMELVKVPDANALEAVGNDGDKAELTVTNALKKERDEGKKAWVELPKLTKVQEKMK